ncbi:MAG: carboxylesterase family protein, partial [Acidimicrobiales bacterium]
ALRWVQDNIEAFGGDPRAVTVAGQSGGAFSAAVMMSRPEGAGLFRRAILQSAPLGLRIPSRAESLHLTEQYMEVLGVEDPAALRRLSWEELLGPVPGLYQRLHRWGAWALAFQPVLDGVTLDSDPLDVVVDESGHDVEVMMGWTREETSFAFGFDPTVQGATADRVIDRMRDALGDTAPVAYAAYAAARPGAGPHAVLQDFTTDELLRMPCLRWAEARAARDLPTWVYQFDYPTPALDGRLAATHCLDLPFTFANFDAWGDAPFVAGIEPGVRDGLTQTMHQSWLSFIRGGNPSHDSLPDWEPYTIPVRTTMRFDAVTSPVGDLAGYWRRQWERAGAYGPSRLRTVETT